MMYFSRLDLGILERGLVSACLFACLVFCGEIGSAQDYRDRDRNEIGRSIDPRTPSARYIPPNGNSPGSYRLGVRVRNSDTGVVLTSVEPGLPAQRAGLEAGDTIISVAGYQVGYVDGRLYDLGDEIARRVDRREQVTMLVQNSRNARLVNITVDFSVGGGASVLSVSGTITTRNSVNLSRNAILTIRLLDITHGHWQHVPIQTTGQQISRRWPIDYQINVRADRVQPGHRYAVEAEVSDQNRTILETASPVPLAGSRKVDLLLVPAKGRPGDISFEDQVTQWYQQYLGRFPTPREMLSWRAELERGGSMGDVQAGILSSSEYFQRNNNDRDSYVRDIYGKLTGKDPTAEQQQELKSQLEKQNDVRYRFTQELLRRFNKDSSDANKQDNR